MIPELYKNHLIYLATPYSHPDPERMLARFEQAKKIAADLTRDGYIVFSPILHSHPISVEHGIRGDWAFWKRIDTAFIVKSAAIVVALMEGWEQSIGVRDETDIAERLGIPIFYYEPR